MRGDVRGDVRGGCAGAATGATTGGRPYDYDVVLLRCGATTIGGGLCALAAWWYYRGTLLGLFCVRPTLVSFMQYRYPLSVSLTLLLLLLGACGNKAKEPTNPKTDTGATKVEPVDTSSTVPATPGSSAGFAGQWTWTNDKDIFTLSLDVDGSKITGHHEAYSQDGRADVSTDDDVSSINGTVQGGGADVTFRSNHAGVTGKATLRLQGDKLIWEVTSATAGELLIPRKATLVRDDEPSDSDNEIHDESSGGGDESIGATDSPAPKSPKRSKESKTTVDPKAPKNSKTPTDSKTNTSK